MTKITLVLLLRAWLGGVLVEALGGVCLQVVAHLVGVMCSSLVSARFVMWKGVAGWS
jgi:hypothetical protein